MIIYKTTNLLDGKIYIGQTRKTTPGYYGSGTVIKHAIKKYGKENFSREILEECSTEEELNKREIYWIKYYDAINPEIGYNILIGGANINMFDQPNGDLIREKIKKNHAHYWLGKKQPPEMIEKRRQAMIGKPSKCKGRTLSEETKQKISKNNAKYWQGKHIPEDIKIKISETKKGITPIYLYAKHTLVKDGSIYNVNGVTSFLKEHSLSRTQFYRLIRGDIKKYKGFSLQK